MPKHHQPDALSQALAEPSRRAILENLRFGQKSVSEIVAATELKQPNVSNHLAKMREQGIVRASRLGRQVFYSIAMPIADVLLRLHETAADPLAQGEIHSPHPLSNNATHLASLSAAPPLADASSPDLTAHTFPASTHHNNHFAGAAATSPLSATVNEWRDAWFQCAITGQEGRALALVNAMLAHRVDMETIYTEIFQPVLNRIGEMYVRGEADETHEHLASALTEQMMAKIAQFYTPVVRTSRRAILGCVAGNYHTVGLRMLADSLKARGWETLFLGANVPTASFLGMIASLRPDLVVASCTMAEQVSSLHELATGLAQATNGAPEPCCRLAVGGYYVNEHPEAVAELPITLTASNLHTFLDQVDALFAPSR